jgi:hypothetical protein
VRRVSADLAHERRHAGQAAAVLIRLEEVDIIELKEGEADNRLMGSLRMMAPEEEEYNEGMEPAPSRIKDP